MNWHSMEFCISYARGHHIVLGVCAGYWSFTILGEWVVSSEMGQCPRKWVSRLHNMKRKNACWAEKVGVDTPLG